MAKDRKIDLVILGLGIDTYEAYLKWCTKSKKLLKK